MNGKDIKALRLKKGLTQKQLADFTGIPLGTLGRIESTGEEIKKTATESSLWIFLKNEEDDKQVNEPDGDVIVKKKNANSKKGLIPFYNADFMAGKSDLFYDDGTQHPDYYMDVPEFAGCIAFRAFGDSMEKIIKSSSVLFGLKLDDDWRDSLDYGQIYGITMKNGLRYLKYIRKSQDPDKFLLKSENNNYDDFEISKIKIKNIWLIQGWIDKRA